MLTRNITEKSNISNETFSWQKKKRQKKPYQLANCARNDTECKRDVNVSGSSSREREYEFSSMRKRSCVLQRGTMKSMFFAFTSGRRRPHGVCTHARTHARAVKKQMLDTSAVCNYRGREAATADVNFTTCPVYKRRTTPWWYVIEE